MPAGAATDPCETAGEDAAADVAIELALHQLRHHLDSTCDGSGAGRAVMTNRAMQGDALDVTRAVARGSVAQPSARLDSQLWRRGNGGAETGSTPVPPFQHADLCVSGAVLCSICATRSRRELQPLAIRVRQIQRAELDVGVGRIGPIGGLFKRHWPHAGLQPHPGPPPATASPALRDTSTAGAAV